ncbi:MAG: protein phosphatase CheZ [Gallionellales bacterium GWA2_55_18]|nr:MAG: protein phosphatase CheZ [Gallionellales bacterium GWA2_55_18]
MADNNANQDSEDLESLFDSIVAANVAETHAGAVSENKMVVGDLDANKVISQVGHMARALHDTLRELGLTKEIEKAASSIPDARDRLNYVVTMTHQAAERVLNATEAAQPIVEVMGAEAQRLAGLWQMLFEQKLTVDQFRDMVMQTQAFLNGVPKHTKATNAYLMEIMLAQDFQDLTGQVIKKIIDLTQNMEKQLLALLLESAPPSLKADWSNAGLLNGPVINPHGRSDVVTSQNQVDELLESMGF